MGPLGVTVTNDVEPLDWAAPTVDPSDLGLLLDAVTLGLGRTNGLRHVLARRGHQVRVQDGAAKGLDRLRSACKMLNGIVPRTSAPWAEAVGLIIEPRQGSWWLIVVPEVWVSPTHHADGSRNVTDQRVEQTSIAEFIRERRATRYNRDVNAILDAWVRLLCAGHPIRPRDRPHMGTPGRQGTTARQAPTAKRHLGRRLLHPRRSPARHAQPQRLR